MGTFDWSSIVIAYTTFFRSARRYYVGSCLNLEERLKEHREHRFDKPFTSQSDDWEVFLVIEDLSYRQARCVELHIKQMKSRTYIENLAKYQEMQKELINKYKN